MNFLKHLFTIFLIFQCFLLPSFSLDEKVNSEPLKSDEGNNKTEKSEESEINIFSQDEEKRKQGLTKIMFQATKSQLWIKDSKFGKGKKDDDIIFTTLYGKVFNPPTKIEIVKKEKVDRTTLEGAAVSVVSALRYGDKDWVIENFLNEEKEKVTPVYASKSFLQSNKDFLKIQTGQYIRAITEYGDYSIVYVKQVHPSGEQITEPFVFKKVGNEWKQSVALTDDETFDLISAALAAGTVSVGQALEMVRPEDLNEKDLEKVKALEQAMINDDSHLNMSDKNNEKPFIPKVF